MNHYEPAKDPTVINGTQEAYGFKRGDRVMYTNPDGGVFGPHTVVGFCEPSTRTFEYTMLPSGARGSEERVCERTVYIDSDSPWFPVEPPSLRKIGRGGHE